MLTPEKNLWYDVTLFLQMKKWRCREEKELVHNHTAFGNTGELRPA